MVFTMRTWNCRFCDRSFAYKHVRDRHEHNIACRKTLSAASDARIAIPGITEDELKTIANPMIPDSAKLASVIEIITRLARQLAAVTIELNESRVTKTPANIMNGNNNNNQDNSINITNNNTTNINQNKNVQQNFILNNYGKEDTSHITHEDKVAWAKNPREGVIHYFRKKHFDSSKPENHNMTVANKNREELMVYIDNTWKVVPAKSIIPEEYKKSVEALYDCADNSNMTDDADKYYEEVLDDHNCKTGKDGHKAIFYCVYENKGLIKTK